MGKLVNMLVTLIVIDLMFLITAQQAILSPGSAILSLIFDPSQMITSTWWLSFLTPTNTIIGIATGGAILAVAAFARNADLAVFAGAASVLALTLADFIPIYLFLKDKNEIAAILIMSPIIIIGLIVAIEWLRNKD